MAAAPRDCDPAIVTGLRKSARDCRLAHPSQIHELAEADVHRRVDVDGAVLHPLLEGHYPQHRPYGALTKEHRDERVRDADKALVFPSHIKRLSTAQLLGHEAVNVSNDRSA